jgi:hypothetical protein
VEHHALEVFDQALTVHFGHFSRPRGALPEFFLGGEPIGLQLYLLPFRVASD